MKRIQQYDVVEVRCTGEAFWEVSDALESRGFEFSLAVKSKRIPKFYGQEVATFTFRRPKKHVRKCVLLGA